MEMTLGQPCLDAAHQVSNFERLRVQSVTIGAREHLLSTVHVKPSRSCVFVEW
jgi:hypothetical protein